MAMSTRDLRPGDKIFIGAGDHRVVVEHTDDWFVHVVFFTKSGTGPHRSTLPHIDGVVPVLYEDERAGMGRSWWNTPELGGTKPGSD